MTLELAPLSLGPDRCIGIELRAPIRADRADTLAPIDAALTSLDGYASMANADRARRYPGARTSPLRFQMPVVSFGTLHNRPDRREKARRASGRADGPRPAG